MIDFAGLDEDWVLEPWSEELLAREIDVGFSARGRETPPGKWKSVQGTLESLVQMLLKHEAGSKDGGCYTQGGLIGGTRTASSVKHLDLCVLDLDTGESIERLGGRLRELGLAAVIYTTHSHMKTETEVKKDAVINWLDKKEKREPALDHVLGYLADVKRYQSYILAGATLGEERHTKEGVQLVVKHHPMPKFRVVMPLKERFVIAKRPDSPSPADAVKEWRERYIGASKLLGAFCDRSCVDPSRLFYLPRHAPGGPFEVHIIAGAPLDIDEVERVSDRELRSGPMNVFEAAGAALGGKEGTSYQTPGLAAFFKQYNGRFDIADFLLSSDPDGDRGPMPSGAGRIHRCPNDDQHSNAGDEEDKGFICINASDSNVEAAIAKCQHDSCADLRAPHFVDLICVREGITDTEALKQFCFEIAGEADAQDRTTLQVPSTMPAPLRYAPIKVEHHGQFADELNEVSEKHAIIQLGSSTMVMTYPKQNSEDVMPKTQTLSSFRDFYSHKKVFLQIKGETKPFPLTKMWQDDEDTKRFEGLDFNPVSDVSPKYNAWRGFSVDPIQGDWSFLHDHIRDTICGGNPEYFHWLMTWMSQIVQQPGEKMASSVIVRGGKGSGKSTVFFWLMQLLAPYSLEVSQKNQITGQFNGHMWGRLLIVAEEAFWGGDRDAGNQLKTLISSGQGTMERKGQDAIKTTNYHRWAMVTNEKWVVPASLNDRERRYFVLDCLNTRQDKKHRPFFGKLKSQMLSGGLQAMMFDLLNWRPNNDDWDILWDPPITKALQDQGERSLEPIEAFWLEFARRGSLESCGEGIDDFEWDMDQPCEIPQSDLRAHVRDVARGFKIKADYKHIMEAAQETLKVPIIEKRPSTKGPGPRPWVYVLPPLKEVHAALSERGLYHP